MESMFLKRHLEGILFQDLFSVSKPSDSVENKCPACVCHVSLPYIFRNIFLMNFGGYERLHTFDCVADSEKTILRNFGQHRAVIPKLYRQTFCLFVSLLVLFFLGTKLATKSTLPLPT